MYKLIIKIFENNIVIQKLNSNNNLAIWRVIDINISNLINIIYKKQKLIKKIVISKIVFSLSILFAINISNFEINKTLNSLIKTFENLKINSVRDIIESEIYQTI